MFVKGSGLGYRRWKSHDQNMAAPM